MKELSEIVQCTVFKTKLISLIRIYFTIDLFYKVFTTEYTGLYTFIHVFVIFENYALFCVKSIKCLNVFVTKCSLLVIRTIVYIHSCYVSENQQMIDPVSVY